MRRTVPIEVDDPSRKLGDRDVYFRAELKLRTAAGVGKHRTETTRHVCRSDCICEGAYASFSEERFRRFFR